MRIRWILIAMPLLAANSGCSALHSVGPRIQIVSICDVNRNPDSYVGKTVSIDGTYYSDGANYSYITDNNCAAPNYLLSVGDHARHHDNSVEAYFSARQQYCSGRGSANFCVVATPMVADVRIEMGQAGHIAYGDRVEPVARFVRISSYHFAGK